ncbi:MAG: hypothetical protein E6H69_06245 [Betaproteobacteria bacterium]|nr:MAG: hypothetical protein E6H69_06245 [Betaproteobacteria bacterium]
MLRLTVIADARFTAPALLGSSYLASCAKLIDPLHSMGRPCRGEEAPAQLDGSTVVFDEKGKAHYASCARRRAGRVAPIREER